MTSVSSISRCPVLIIGAGPTGLVLALWLARSGVRIRIVDRNAGPAPFSRALGVQARTLEYYRQLGIADQAVAGGVEAESINLWVRSARVARIVFRRPGEGLTPYPFVLDFAQDRHERMLIAALAAAGVVVERNAELTHADVGEDAVRATLAHGDGRIEVVEAEYLAGCDGARSTVREALGIGFPGGTYSQVFYVADVTGSGRVVGDGVHIALDRADFLAVFAMQGPGHIRLVGTVRDTAAQDAERLGFDDVSPRVLADLDIQVDAVNWFSTYHVHHRVADHFRAGRAFLLGDAAHIHSPAGAQGMNTGIGDAVNLAWKLAAVLGGESRAGVLDSYESERIAFARQLVNTTDRMFSFVTRRGRLAQLVRTRVFPLVAALALDTRVVRRLLFRTVSQLGVNYRASALSAGKGGGVRGGDRLPWVRIGEADNFVPLQSLAWQVHVYGKAGDGVGTACATAKWPLHIFPWQDAMAKAGLKRDAIVLVRPDGYIAMVAAASDAGQLLQFKAQRL
jgi:2-polyprenyl-6-methoxyphenol hydroxylase-like FAD-dependent oxidoreductase